MLVLYTGQIGIFRGRKVGQPWEKALEQDKNRQQTQPTCDAYRGSFLERPGNLTGQKSDFEIKVSGKVGYSVCSDL